MNKKLKSKLKDIKIVAIDVDGVLTDGGMYYTDKGEVMKKFNAKDGKAIELLQGFGIIVAFITGEKLGIIKRRAEKLKVRDVYLGCSDKAKAANELLKKYGLVFRNLLYVGDDIGDLGLIKKANFSCCPLDGSKWIKKEVDLVISRNGGQGVISEIAYLMKDLLKA